MAKQAYKGAGIGLEHILGARVPTTSGQELSVSFKKTIQTKAYETEVVDMRTTISLPEGTSSAMREMVSTLLLCQLKYQALAPLVVQNKISQDLFNDEVADCETVTNMMYEKLSPHDPDLSKLFQ